MVRRQAFKYRIEPNGEQQRKLRQFAGMCRFVFNKALALQQENRAAGEKFIGYVPMAKQLTAWRNGDETPWLKDAPVHPLQHALKNLDRAYQNFFAKRADFPRFKKKGQHDSFRYPDSKQIKLDQAGSRILLPKLGWLKYRRSREVLGTLKNVTVSHSAGHWYVSIQTEREVETPLHASPLAAGIDLGIVRFATLWDGHQETVLQPLHSFKRHQQRMAKAQRQMSRKTKFSNNWKRAKARIQRINRQIANARNDYLHKASHSLVKLPQSSLQITPEVISKSLGYRRDFFAAEVLAFNTRPELEGLAEGIVNELLSEFTSAPASVRYRLVERILAWEFPDAPITVFAWLAKMGVVKPAKYSGRNVASHIDAAVLRAASLSEFEMIRAGVCAVINCGNGPNWPRLLLKNQGEKLTSEAKSRLIDGMHAEERRQTLPGLANRNRVLLESRLLDEPYLRAFFADCESMAPYARKAIYKQSMALTDIAAAMISIRIKKDLNRAIYVELGESSIAHDVKRALNEHGFEVNARTIYRRRRQKLSATPDLSVTVLPLCLIPNSALKSAPPFKSVVPKASACAGLPA